MLSESFSTYAQNSISSVQQNKLSLVIILLLPLFYYAYFDYQGWYALGPGGLPHNVFGWLVQSLLRLRASRNVRDSSCYDVAMRSSELERTRFLDGQLPDWIGEAPQTAVWIAPHRQLNQVATTEIKKVRPLVLKGFFWKTTAKDPTLIRSLKSCRLWRQHSCKSSARTHEPLNLARLKLKAGPRHCLSPQRTSAPIMTPILVCHARYFTPTVRRRVARTPSSRRRMPSWSLTRAGERGMEFRVRGLVLRWVIP